MKKARIANKSPLLLEMKAGTYYWCACGESKKQPFCDGSHVGTEFEPKAVMFDQIRSVFWCQCKQSENAPFCDGAHKELKS